MNTTSYFLKKAVLLVNDQTNTKKKLHVYQNVAVCRQEIIPRKIFNFLQYYEQSLDWTHNLQSSTKQKGVIQNLICGWGKKN